MDADEAADLLGGGPAGVAADGDVGPGAASASAIARPMPRELPVTNAFLPRRLKLGTSASPSGSAAGVFGGCAHSRHVIHSEWNQGIRE